MTETLETEWVTDAELIRRSGVPEKIMRRNLHEYDAKPDYGFPRKFKPYGNRRHWPSVQAYFANLNKVVSVDNRKRA
jgi:hypothetical protein